MIKLNNKYNIKFPDEIIVDDTNEALYRNQEGKLKGNRNSVKYINNRVHNKFSNKPIKGWEMLSYDEGWNGRQSRVYVTNPALFGNNTTKISICAGYIFNLILTNLTLINGKIQEPCVIGFDQGNMPILIPESHKCYQKASYPNPDLPIPTCANDLIIGAAYEIDDKKSVYVGELKKGLRVDCPYDYITIKKQKFYVFFEEESDQVSFRTNIGKTLINNTISVDDKTPDQCNDILELVKKSVINSENGGITSIGFDLDSVKEAKVNEEYKNETVLYNGKQYNVKDCFVYLEQESPTKINILIKPGDANYVKMDEIDFDIRSNKVEHLSSSLVYINYSTGVSEIKGVDNYVPSKPVQKLFSLISKNLTLSNIFGQGLIVCWDDDDLLSLNLTLVTASGKIFHKQLISRHNDPVRSIGIKEL